MSTIFSNSRDELRRQWLQAWKKARDRTILTPLETQLIDLIIEHPEYHTWLEEGDSCVQDEFHPEGGQSNPFLHLSMHRPFLPFEHQQLFVNKMKIYLMIYSHK